MPRAMVARVAAGAQPGRRIRPRRRCRREPARRAARPDPRHAAPLRSRAGDRAALSRRGLPDALGRGAAVVRAVCTRIRPLRRVHGGGSGGARLRAARALAREGLRQRAAAQRTCASATRWKRGCATTMRRATSTRAGGSTRARGLSRSAGRQILAAGNSHPPMALRVNTRRVARAIIAAPRRAGIAARAAGRCGAAAREAGAGRAAAGLRRRRGLGPGRRRAARRRSASISQTGSAYSMPAPRRAARAAHILERADVALTALDMDADALRAPRRAISSGCGLRARRARGRLHAAADWWTARLSTASSPTCHARLRASRAAIRTSSGCAAPATCRRSRRARPRFWTRFGRCSRAGGKLLYVTCSVFPQENERRRRRLSSRARRARGRLPLPDGEERQWLPGPQHDGFFYALIQKQA